jgi:hypothetical protein
MRAHRLTHRSATGICTLGAIVGILLVLAVAASAMPIDNGRPAPPASSPPTVIHETVVAPAGHGLDPVAWVLISVAAGAAIVGAGYLGARIAIRMTNVHVS